MADWRLICPTCGGPLCRETGCLSRCAGCRRLFAVTDGYAEPMASNYNLSGADDAKAEAALRQRHAYA